MKDSYTEKWYRQKRASKRIAAREVVALLQDLVAPKSVVDLGCGDGTWLSVFAESVSTYLGVDGDWIDRNQLQIPEDHFRVADLAQPFRLSETYDLAVSLEVAEHLPEAAADQFIQSLTSLAPVVLFSAAIPGQGGTHHINERWQHYWARLFRKYDFVPVDTLRDEIWSNEKVHSFYRQNMILYVNKKKLDDLHIGSTNVVENLQRLSRVHPDIFEQKIDRLEGAQMMKPGYISLKNVIMGIPRLIYYTIRVRLGRDESIG